MNSKKKKALLLVALIAIFITLVITFSGLAHLELQNIKEVAQLTKEALTDDSSSAEENIKTMGAHNKDGSLWVEALPGNINKVFIPTANGAQLYCIEKGVSLKSGLPTVAEIRALQGKKGTVTSPFHPATLPDKLYSNTYYECVNDHKTMIPSGAYIVTAPSNYIAPYNGSYSYGSSSSFAKGENISQEVRQVAMWLNPEMNKGENFYESGASFSYIDMAEELKNEAMEYRDYENSLNASGSEPIKNVTTEKVKIAVDQKEETLILGPYKIEYTNGNSASAKFAGISNMEVKGYNDKDKKVFIKDLEIISYIQNGKENKLDFFTPLKEEGYVDKTENSYPASGQEFYIKIKNPNAGVSEVKEKVRYVDINVEYSYMKVTATQCTLKGNQLVATPVPTLHYDTGFCSINYEWNVTNNPLKQQEVIDAWGERNLYKTNIHLTGEPEETPGTPDTPDKPDTPTPGNPTRPTIPDLIVTPGPDVTPGPTPTPTPTNTPTPPTITLEDITMKLGGYTWEDVLEGKESLANGTKTEADIAIPNVKVALYECEINEKGTVQYKDGKPIGKVANLLSDTDKEELSKEEILRRVNPQLTNENGYYQFDGLDVFKKYYVTFEYNGQIYMPTDYLVTGSGSKQTSVQNMVNASLYNTDIWAAASKATEASEVRENYNSKFAEIGSSPKGYKSSDSLKTGMLVEGYNETYSINDLMGYELQENGTYSAKGPQLIDSLYTIDSNGNIVQGKTISEGEISKKIKEYIQNEYKYPDENALKSIYQSIAGTQSEIWKKLQYIEDCKIQATTASISGEIDLYPVYDKFIADENTFVIPGVGTLPQIYNGQYYINLGLWRREQNNLALRKDIYRTATRINGKTEVYTYNKRTAGADYWEIQLRMQDYNNYYGSYYNREIYSSDYEYKPEITNLYGKELELYVTYQIVVRNLSQGIVNEVTEVVDYYDTDYTYMPNLSWVMYNESGIDEETAVPSKSYYNMINNLDIKQINYAKDINASYSTTANESGNYCGTSIYGTASQSNIETNYNSLYVRGLNSKKLQTGEDAYIYLTFKVNPDSKGPVILDEDNSLKQNYVEINGYKSYYKDGTQLPNDKAISGNETVAGIIDNNSTPGNLRLEDLQGDKYEKNFEDDTDRAKGIKVTLDTEATREINGTVWEDERTQNINNAIIGDGVRQEGEIGVKGITVELVEKMENGSEYVWQTVETDENGVYKFTGYIPGNYIVRFRYGNDTKNVLIESNGGENAVSYNGQDFKSTVYSKDLKNNVTLSKYEDEYYNIEEADKLANQKTNISDAKDLWESKKVNTGRTVNNVTNYQEESYQGRTNVNNYSSGEIDNSKAQILAAPYAASVDNSMIQELIENTNMVAETPIIVAEIEYNRTISNGSKTESNGEQYLYDNEKNGNYTLNNVDFGLTERPKAQLELDKKVTNIKLTLSDGTTLFDANKSVSNLSFLEGSSYNLDKQMKNNKYQEYYKESKTDKNYNRYSYRTELEGKIAALYPNGRNGLIQAIVDDELLKDATLQVSYELTIKNVSETDYSNKDFYYLGTVASEENKVTTNANMVIDYVANNLQYSASQNTGWTLAKTQGTEIPEGLVDSNVKEKTKLYTNILATTQLSKNLKPGENITKDLVLTQIIYGNDETTDNEVYENIAEIVKTSNTVGRRMAYSIVGNQDPTTIPTEVDSAKAETIVVVPPFGISPIYIYGAVALAAVIVLTVGIIFIKKKVVK